LFLRIPVRTQQGILQTAGIEKSYYAIGVYFTVSSQNMQPYINDFHYQAMIFLEHFSHLCGCRFFIQ